jgi:hypothetical protein
MGMRDLYNPKISAGAFLTALVDKRPAESLDMTVQFLVQLLTTCE